MDKPFVTNKINPVHNCTFQFFLTLELDSKIQERNRKWYPSHTKTYLARQAIEKRAKYENRKSISTCIVTRGPFLESPGNFTDPKSNIQIEI